MTITSRLFFLFTFFLFSINFLSAQNRDNYGLLWEIQHKNSNKKSYLFGTMHVKDSRVFKFSDSVIPAIKKSEMFALEVNPDSVYNNIDEDYFSTDSENIFKNILSKKDYQRLKDRFHEINKSDLDSFPMMHPHVIESMLKKTKHRSDDRRTFLDAYLYGLAYYEGKEITGLEKIEDQIPKFENINNEALKENILQLLDSSAEEQDEQMEKMIQLYYNGDIDQILKYVENFGQMNEILIRRNKIMTNSLDKIMQDKTIFAAVGTAHLPGKDGILDLLQKKGYTVRQVNATFSQDYEQYHIVPNTDRWFNNLDDSLGYTVSTPTKPIPLDVLGKFKSMSSSDLIFGGTFAYMAIDLRAETLKDDFNVIENIVQSQIKSEADSIISQKTFVKDSIEFTEILVQKENEVSRMRIAFTNKILYAFFSENSLEEITSPYADAFFNSIKVFSPKVPPSVWRTKTDSLGAYSISIPDEENDRSQKKENPNGEEASPYILNIFTTMDRAENTLYLFRYNDQPLGYYLNEKEEYYTYFNEYFKQHGTLVGDIKNIKKGEIEGKEYEVMISDKYHAKAKLFLRGNRTYLLMAQKLNENEKISEDDRFFNSFEFLPYAKTSFDTLVKINDQYSFKAPSKEIIFEEQTNAYSEFGSLKNYSTIDFATAGTYLVQQVKLTPFYKKKSLQDFYDDYSETLTEYNDSIISNINTTWAGKPAREIRIQNKNTHIKQRMKLLLDEDTILLFLTYLGDEEIDKPQVDEFFNSLEINKKSKTFDLSASKADLLFKKLKSKDSTDFYEAKNALRYYDFDTSEYNILKKNLKKHFIDDTTNYGIKYHLINAMAKLENQETLKTFTDFYKNKNSSYSARLEILSKMMVLKNPEATSAYFYLLENEKPERISGKSYNVFQNWSDTIPLFVANDATFSKLAAIDDYRDKIASTYTYNVLGDSIYGNKMPLLKGKLISHMYRDSELYVDSLARKKFAYLNYSLISSYIDICKESMENNPEVAKTLKLLSENLTREDWLLDEVIMASVALNIDVDPNKIKEAFEEIYSRFELMASFINSEKSELIPEKYLEPIEFHKISLYQTIGYDYDEYPEYFNFLGITTVEGKNYYAYSFSYSEEDEEKHLGISEETEINFSDFKAATSYFTWKTLEEDWKSQAENIIKTNSNSSEFASE